MNSYLGCYKLQNLDIYNVDIPDMQVFVNHEIRLLSEDIFSAGTALK